jgi:hypothetical protein
MSLEPLDTGILKESASKSVTSISRFYGSTPPQKYHGDYMATCSGQLLPQVAIVLI